MTESIFSFMTEDVAIRLEQAQTEAEFRKILLDSGATEEQIADFVEYLRTMPLEASGELSEDELDIVAGGGNPILQKMFCKMAYRVQTGKIFVKATYDEDKRTITVTNRFGKKKSIEYMY